jgi:central kinetochore subunit Mis15/CHL4
MHILNGSSRFGHSLGIWAPYADGTIDILPLGKPEDHSLLQRSKYATPSDDDADEISSESENNDELNPKELKRLKRIANLRFKGTTTGKYKSTKLFDDNSVRRSRRLLDVPDSDEELEEERFVSEFASIAPLQHVTFKLEQNINKENPQEYTSISMSLTGLDVFAGLHELSVSTTNKDDAIVDPTTIPDWLTGQEGSSSGTVRNSTFTNTS